MKKKLANTSSRIHYQVNRKNLLLLSYIMIGPPKQNKYLVGGNNKYYHKNLANIRLGSSRVIEERNNRFLLLALSYIMIGVSKKKNLTNGGNSTCKLLRFTNCVSRNVELADLADIRLGSSRN